MLHKNTVNPLKWADLDQQIYTVFKVDSAIYGLCQLSWFVYIFMTFSNFRNVLGASLPSLSGGTFVTVRSSVPRYKSLRSHCLVSLSKARDPHCLVLITTEETIPQCPFLVGFQQLNRYGWFHKSGHMTLTEIIRCWGNEASGQCHLWWGYGE